MYSTFIWFFPVTLISAIIGGLIGAILYWAGTKIVEQYVFRLMNLSLLIIAPYLVYVLLIQPYQFTIKMATESVQQFEKPRPKNLINIEELAEMPQDTPFVQAYPAQVYDSLLISLEGTNRMRVTNPHNGFFYTW